MAFPILCTNRQHLSVVTCSICMFLYLVLQVNTFMKNAFFLTNVWYFVCKKKNRKIYLKSNNKVSFMMFKHTNSKTVFKTKAHLWIFFCLWVNFECTYLPHPRLVFTWPNTLTPTDLWAKCKTHPIASLWKDRLPPGESKDVLQDMSDPWEPETAQRNQTATQIDAAQQIHDSLNWKLNGFSINYTDFPPILHIYGLMNLIKNFDLNLLFNWQAVRK